MKPLSGSSTGLPTARRATGWLGGAYGSRLFAIVRGNALLLLANLLTGVIAARALGPSLRGEFAGTVSWCVAISAVLTLGVTQAVVVYKDAVNWLRPWMFGQVVLGALAGAGMCIGLRMSGAQTWLGVEGVIGGAAWTAGAVASSLSSGWLQRHGRMGREFQIARLAPQAVLIVSMCALWIVGLRRSETWLLVVGLLSGACAVTFLIVNLRNSSPDGPRIRREDALGPEPRGFVALAAGSLIVVVGAQVIYRLDALVVAVALDPRQVGLYAVALGAGGACYSLGTAAGMLMFAELRLAATPPERRALILVAVRRAVLIGGATCLPALVLTSPLVRIFYGEAFLPAVTATRVILVASVVLAADYVLVHAVLGLDAKRYLIGAQLLVGVLTMILLVRATASDDIVRVAFVSLATYPVSVCLHLIVVLLKTRSTDPLTLGGTAAADDQQRYC